MYCVIFVIHICRDHANIVKYLLDKGANVHTADTGGFTPLHVATRDESRDALATLLKHGIDPNKKVSNI